MSTSFVIGVVALSAAGCDWLGHERRAAWSRTSTTYVHDGYGAGPALLTGAGGVVLEERRAEPFGAPLEAADFAAEPFGALGKPVDAATAWSYHGARWMASSTARWLTPDPPVKAPDPRFLTSPWDLHPYAYARQAPPQYWDPDGKNPKEYDGEEEEDEAICGGIGLFPYAMAAAVEPLTTAVNGVAMIPGPIGGAADLLATIATMTDRIANGDFKGALHALTLEAGAHLIEHQTGSEYLGRMVTNEDMVVWGEKQLGLRSEEKATGSGRPRGERRGTESWLTGRLRLGRFLEPDETKALDNAWKEAMHEAYRLPDNNNYWDNGYNDGPAQNYRSLVKRLLDDGVDPGLLPSLPAAASGPTS